jgi:hypothetical protein
MSVRPQPIFVILQGCWDRFVSNGVVNFDEYATSKWPSETKAYNGFPPALASISQSNDFHSPIHQAVIPSSLDGSRPLVARS